VRVVFYFLLWLLALSNSLFAYVQNAETIDETIGEHIIVQNDSKDDPTLFVPDQLATLTGDSNQLIGGIVSPVSGNPCLREIDLKVSGAQEINLCRVYVSPYMPYLFHKHWDEDCYLRRSLPQRSL